MLVNRSVWSLGAGVTALLISQSVLAKVDPGVAEIKLKYNVESMLENDSWARFSVKVYLDSQDTVNNYCQPLTESSIPIDQKAVGYSEEDKKGQGYFTFEVGSNYCIVLERRTRDSIGRDAYQREYYGPFKANQTCNVDYGTDNYPDIAGFDVRGMGLTMRAKINGYPDQEGNGDVANCIPEVNWNDKIQRVSIKPTPNYNPPTATIYQKGSSKTCSNNSGRGSVIYSNRLMATETIEYFNNDLHYGVYVTDGQSNNPFCVELSGGDTEKTIYKGPYAVNWDNTCELTPVIENGKMTDITASAGCTSGPIN